MPLTLKFKLDTKMMDAKMMDVALQSFGRPACEVNVKKGQEDNFLEAC